MNYFHFYFFHIGRASHAKSCLNRNLGSKIIKPGEKELAVGVLEYIEEGRNGLRTKCCTKTPGKAKN